MMAAGEIGLIRLEKKHIPAIKEHLKALNERDRRYRFSIPVSDGFIDRYIDLLDWDLDYFFGVVDNDDVLAFGHLARIFDTAELGLSIDKRFRGNGIGKAMLHYAVDWGKERGLSKVCSHCLAINGPMLHIALESGFNVKTELGERDAWILLD